MPHYTYHKQYTYSKHSEQSDFKESQLPITMCIAICYSFVCVLQIQTDNIIWTIDVRYFSNSGQPSQSVVRYTVIFFYIIWCAFPWTVFVHGEGEGGGCVAVTVA